jgi:hypothetical protein
MCFSANASLAAFFIGLAGQVALYTRGGQSRALAFGFSTLTLMQLFEYIMWENPCSEEVPNTTNKYASKLAMISNFAQPLTISISLLYFRHNGKYSKELFIGTAAYAILLAYDVITAWEDVTCSAPTGVEVSGNQCTPTSCGLEWQWTSKFNGFSWTAYFVLLHFATLTAVKPFSTAVITTAYIDISFVIAFLLHRNQRSIGSHWCFYAVLLPWLVFFLPQE